MNRIISLSPVTLTITIRPKADGTANVETRVEPPTVDVLVLSQAMLGIVTNYLLQIQQANRMLVGKRSQQEGDSNGQ